MHGDRSKPGNYQPISLLSITSKLLERHYHWLIIEHLSNSCPLASNQWGFQRGKSTVTSLLTVVHAWFQALESGKEIVATFYDLRKAFDTVPHIPLLQKLSTSGLHQHVLKWIQSYLTLRSQRVTIGGESSPPLPVLSGVPQGSVLGPLLFLVYIDSIASLQFSPGTDLNLFADDMLLYKCIDSTEHVEYLQHDNDQSHWVKTNYLSLNPTKCKYMIVTRKRNKVKCRTIFFEGVPLKQVDNFKYLGVILSFDLSWTAQVESVCTKARKLVGLLYRRFHNADTNTLFQLYTTCTNKVSPRVCRTSLGPFYRQQRQQVGEHSEICFNNLH